MATLCDICFVIFHSEDDRRSHLHAVHVLKTDAPFTKSQVKRAFTKVRSTFGATSPGREHGTDAQIDPYAQSAKERKMDATYGMGGTVRDHGQFGSAPSHDGMDDESSP
jgi:hypothetical protein